MVCNMNGINMKENGANVSIIIPVYNSEAFLPHCIESLQQQTYRDWTAIFVNDGSTDNSLQILQEYTERDSRIRLINKSNGGAASARNAGLDAADTEYITFVDSDDTISPSFLEKTLHAAVTHHCDLVVTSIKYRKRDCGVLISGVMEFPPNLYFKGVHVGPCAKLYRKEIIERHSLRFPEDMAVAEDFVFSTMYAIKTRIICGIPEALYIYNDENEESLVHRFARREMPLEMYRYNFEAPWRTYCRLISDNDREKRIISECAYELYRAFWRMYYASCKYVSAEDKKKLTGYFRRYHRAFTSHVSLFRRISLPQRYPRLHPLIWKIWLTVKRNLPI